MSVVVDGGQGPNDSLDPIDCKLFSCPTGPAKPFFSTDAVSCRSNGSTAPSPSSRAASFDLPSDKDAKDRDDGQEVAIPREAAAVVAAALPQLQIAAPPTPYPSPTPACIRPRSFLSLPADIHHLIITEHLPYDSILALRATSSHFRSLAPPLALKRLRAKIVAEMLAQERALLLRWVPIPYGRLDGRPAKGLTCYSCLQHLPITHFFARQVFKSRGLGRKRASERWCKACAIKQGKITHGIWMSEVTYGYDDDARYRIAMEEELDVSNQCATCPPERRYQGQLLWWGCVDCFEKEERRLRLWHSAQRRGLHHHCTKAKEGTKAFFEPENLRDIGQDLRWKMSLVFSGGWLGGRYRPDPWWVGEHHLLKRICRHCTDLMDHLDPRRARRPAEDLGTRAKTSLKNVLGRARGAVQTGHGITDEGGNDNSSVAHADCILCNAAAETDPYLHPLPRHNSTQHAQPSHTNTKDPSSSSPSSPLPILTNNDDGHHHHHDHHDSPPQQQQQQQQRHHTPILPPRRQVRCWRCWRPERSRRRRRRDDGMVYGSPLLKDRWCDGCVAEHDCVIAMRKARKAWWSGVVVERGSEVTRAGDAGAGAGAGGSCSSSSKRRNGGEVSKGGDGLCKQQHHHHDEEGTTSTSSASRDCVDGDNELASGFDQLFGEGL